MTLKKLNLSNEKGFTLVELMIVVAIIGILAAVAIPNFIAYRNKAFCSGVESDANNVIAAIADYFAIPTHTDVATGDQTFAPPVNPYVILSAAPSTAITVQVGDASGRCPSDYRTANPIDAGGSGWSAQTYQKVMAQ
jgi:prepilin-type N-terminal cleavage/methylation domain-containing protein